MKSVLQSLEGELVRLATVIAAVICSSDGPPILGRRFSRM